MSYSFIKEPHYVEPKAYEYTIDKIANLLKNEPAILSIYRLGNVNHPGISDIDLVVVFKDNEKCGINVHDHLDAKDCYLLTHEVGGVPEKYFKEVYAYSFWDNLEFMWGKNHLNDDFKKKDKIVGHADYKEQIGLEFLIKNFLELSVQRSYGIIKKRSLLQEIKGIRYDIKFLKLQNSELDRYVKELLNRLDNWFLESWKNKEMSKWLDDYYHALKQSINQLSENGKKLWIPKRENYRYGRNVTLKKGRRFEVKSNGVFLPALLISKHKKLYNAHTRLNSFEIEVNFTSEDPTKMNQDRLALIKKCAKYNQEHLPYFGTLLSSLATHFV